MFRCNFSMEDIEMGSPTSKSQTSGDASWSLQVSKVKDEKEKEVLKIFVKCELEDQKKALVADDWHIDVDHIVRLVNHEDSKNSICKKGSAIFNKDKNQSSSGTISLEGGLEKFLLNDELTFEVEIGVKNSEGLLKTADFSVKTANADAILTEIVGFQNAFRGGRRGKNKNEYSIEEVENPEVFHVFIKFVNDIPVQFTLEEIKELNDLATKYCVDEVKTKCRDFLMNSVVDDALALKYADMFQMQDVIAEKLKSLNTISELKSAFKYYRKFSDESMRLLLKKIIAVA
uniref:BTB domain-containing protein n=1 Tax=Caenorhabditis tropicalis TaxID=1561998 RepID=A0A1I7U2G2_9PELO